MAFVVFILWSLESIRPVKRQVRDIAKAVA